jgi:hypothetical protein
VVPAVVLACAGCANHFAYVPPPTSALRASTPFKCVVLHVDDMTDGQYQAGATQWGARLLKDDVDADAQKIAGSLLMATRTCDSVAFDAKPGWDDARRAELRAQGYRIAARLVLEKMVVESNPNWYVFIDPISVLAAFGLPTIMDNDTTTLNAKLDLVDLETGDLVDSIDPGAITKDRSVVWGGYIANHTLQGALEPTWAQWGEKAVAQLETASKPKLLALLGGSSTGSAAVASAATASSPVAGASGPATAAPAGPVGSFVSAAPQPNAYAIVIGVEKYSASLPPPTGARADAQRFSEMARSSLGLRPDHVQTLFDEQATKGSIERALAAAQASVPPGGRIYFYFSGHGAPDASAGTPYIVPTDGDPQFLDATAIQMKEVLSKLGQSKAREVLAIVDSCFSGAGGRSVLPPGARPIVRVREEAAPAQLALFSASSGSEISGPAPDGNGGLFTKYVLDGLGTGAADMNGDGQVSLGELSQWVQPRVSREAKKANRDQNPALTVGKGLGSADSFIVEWGLAAK